MSEMGRGVPAPSGTADREIVISRVIRAPRELVFEAFTEVRHLSRWWGPEGFTTTTRAFEFRVDGVWYFVMHGPDGTDYQEWISWTEITPPERIALLHGEARGDPNAFESVLTFATVAAGTPSRGRCATPTSRVRARQCGSLRSCGRPSRLRSRPEQRWRTRHSSPGTSWTVTVTVPLGMNRCSRGVPVNSGSGRKVTSVTTSRFLVMPPASVTRVVPVHVSPTGSATVTATVLASSAAPLASVCVAE